MPAENPMNHAKAFFSQEDYDRLRAEGVTEFAPWSSIPLINASPAFPGTFAVGAREKRGKELRQILQTIQNVPAGFSPEQVAAGNMETTRNLISLIRKGVPRDVIAETAGVLAGNDQLSAQTGAQIIAGIRSYDLADDVGGVGSLVRSARFLGLERIEGFNRDFGPFLQTYYEFDVPAEPAQAAEGEAEVAEQEPSVAQTESAERPIPEVITQGVDMIDGEDFSLRVARNLLAQTAGRFAGDELTPEMESKLKEEVTRRLDSAEGPAPRLLLNEALTKLIDQASDLLDMSIRNATIRDRIKAARILGLDESIQGLAQTLEAYEDFMREEETRASTT